MSTNIKASGFRDWLAAHPGWERAGSALGAALLVGTVALIGSCEPMSGPEYGLAETVNSANDVPMSFL
jgi:hypothetical protein